MRKIIVVSCLYVVCMGATAQKTSPDAIPISKEDVLKFKTVLDVYGLPLSYKVESLTMITRHKGEVFVGPYRLDISDPRCAHDLSLLTSGDHLSFEDVIIKKGDRQIKLASKSFVIK